MSTHLRSVRWICAGLLAAPYLAFAQGPVWNWAKTQDAGNTEYVRDIAVETTTGNIYVVGAYQSASATVAPYGLPASMGGSVDAFIAKLDPNGNLLWSRSIGSTQEDGALGVAISGTGLVVATGFYDNPIAGLGLSNAGSRDAFIISYDASGTVQWVKSITGPHVEYGTGVAISGNTLVAYGTYTYHTLIGGVLSAVGLTSGRRYAYLNAYNASGTLIWSLSGLSDDDLQTERITADATNVYVVGGTEGTSLSWRNSTGNSSTTVTTSNGNALFASAVSLAGGHAWTRLINNPGDAESECNGVAVDCAGVYITGRTHTGSLFPGGITPMNPGTHDYWFLGSLNPTNGTTNWVRTASSSIGHGVTGYDVSVGRNGQIHVAGMTSGTLTTDGGTVIAGNNDTDLLIARFNRDGTAVWHHREANPDDEHALAIAPTGIGGQIVGGQFEDALTLGSNTYPGTNGTDLFTARFTDPDWTNVSNNPARFAQPGPFCSSNAPFDLNNYLLAYADTVVASSNVITPEQADGPPNGVGASFSTTGGWAVLDLADTVLIGEAVSLLWRSQTAGLQARMLVSSSLDGVNWSISTTYSTTSGTYVTTSYPVPVNARFIKVQRHSNALYTAFLLDAARFLGSSMAGGTWSGGAYVSASGSFTPSASGPHPVTYTVILGSCNYTHTRTILVDDPPEGGTISGGGTYCPGASGVLTLTGSSGTVIRWERSVDGVTWFPLAESSDVLAWSGITGTMRFRVLVDGGACGTIYSSTTTIIVQDLIPPTVVCPQSDTLFVTAASCTAAYNVPNIASTDNCLTFTSGSGIVINSNGNILLVNGTAIATDDEVSIGGGAALQLGPGTHNFSDTITDGSGNQTICNWEVSVLDTIAPVIANCPDTVELFSPANGCLAQYIWPTLTSTDNCDPDTESDYRTWVTDLDNGDVTDVTGEADHWFAPGDYRIRERHQDNSLNETFCEWSIIVRDTIAPVIDCSNAYSVSYTGVSCGAQVDILDLDTLIQDNCARMSGSLTADHASGIWPPDTVTVTFTALDIHGNTGTCTAQIIVMDNAPPTISCPGDAELAQDAGACTATVPALGVPVISDNCSSASWTQIGGPIAGESIGLGTHPVTYEVTDGTYSATCTFNLVVDDLEAPTLSCPSVIAQLNVGVDCTKPLPDYRASASAGDNCGGVTLTQSPAPGTPVGPSNVNVTITATAGGLTTECTFIVPVVDNTAPSFPASVGMLGFVPANACTINAPGYQAPAENCPGVTIVHVSGPMPGDALSPGTYLMRYRAQDASNNVSAIQSMPITVSDTIAPLITCPANQTINATAGNCNSTMPDLRGLVIASDNCGTVTLAQAPAPGATVTGTFTVVFTATDAFSNQRSCSIQATVLASALPDLAYAQGSFCETAGIIAPVAAMPAGGNFTCATCASAIASDGSFSASAIGIGTHTIQYQAPVGSCFSPSIDSFLLSIADQPAAGSNGTFTICSNSASASLLSQLGGTPEPGGSWSGPSSVIGDMFDPATMNPGVYTYTLSAAAPCVSASASITVSETTPFSAGSNGALTVCSNAPSQSLMAFLGGMPASGGTWSGPSPVVGHAYIPASMNPGVYTYTVIGPVPCGSSSATVTVTEIPSSTTTTTASSCDSYTWAVNGTIYTTSGSYTHVSGCHAETLVLTITVSGTPCDDGNALTGNDVYGADCICAGQLIDCLGVPGGAALIGTPCDDGNTLTGNDVYGADCICAGELIDCLGVPGGSALIGTACDDGNALTGNDVYGADCICAGQLIDCLGVPGGAALIGTPCDDGNALTGNDVYGANCICAGELIDCLGVPGGAALIGTPCDDGNALTGNDVYGADCICAGQLIDCLGVPGGSALIGTACDDVNALTGNDVDGANCICAGELIDCLRVPGGAALIGTPLR
ncbi:MAG: hypothetical protein IPK70_09135 [Flavobacteriales bacterium]|nr:hypothetical protein [Flavobacteriales bacterium]